ncbi:MAG TPA: TetR/AcrR family transcriptional regulator [Lachnospiraceae bacterium]|nr:TetR/AcrR family transcriptional regulator [Lachnospiraceae bacterium]
MNNKFFDLKKEKQDRMINGALKVFAENSYKRASTDKIVKEASISKGLLFHYFISKAGLYEFVYDYSVKYMNLELSNLVNSGEKDYFQVRRQIEYSKLQIMKNYPYMQMFLNNVSLEDSVDFDSSMKKKIEAYNETNSLMYANVDTSLFAEKVDVVKLYNIVDLTVEGLMREAFRDNNPSPDSLYKETVSYFDMLKELTYKK